MNEQKLINGQLKNLNFSLRNKELDSFELKNRIETILIFQKQKIKKQVLSDVKKLIYKMNNKQWDTHTHYVDELNFQINKLEEDG